MLNDIYPWHVKQWQFFQQQLATGRVPQAILLQGPSGLGKSDFAKSLASFLLCDQPQQFACGACRSCELVGAGSHPDLLTIAPLEKSKAIRVDQIRQLTDKLNTTAHRAHDLQVAVISPAELMNRSAANALLKTLEEPNGQVVLILVANHIATVPATILSRCQRVLFSAQADASTVEWVQQRVDPALDAALLLRLADFAPLRAVALAQTDYLALRDNLLQHMWQIISDCKNPLAPVPQYIKYDFELLLYALLTLVMDMSRLQLGVQTQYVVNLDRTEPLQAMGKKLRATFLQKYLQKIQHAYRLLISGTHINVQLMLESLFAEWAGVSAC